MFDKFVVVDLETTGNSPTKGDKIIQFGAVVIENRKITHTFSSLINPMQKIPVFIEGLTGLNDDMVKDAPIFAEIAPEVTALLDGAIFVAHNVFFDFPFLQEELKQAGFKGFLGPVVDTVEMARILYPTALGYKLSELADQEHFMHERPHQADSDAYVTAELLLRMFQRLEKLPRTTLRQLILLSGGLKSDLRQLFEYYLDQKDHAGDAQLGSIEIFNGLALKKSTTSQSGFPTEPPYSYPTSVQEKTKMLERVLPAFTARTGQFEMMDGVFQALQTASHLLIEAGTGVGKSLGYLLPAAYFSKQNGMRIVISTQTIQLQEQLMDKEIPLLEQIMPFKINAVLLKGKNHYISLERFSRTLLDQNDNYDTIIAKMQILVWLLETVTGDKDELNLSSGGQLYWNKIKTEQWTTDLQGDWRDKDFYLRARNNADHADLIITNHSLLLSDLASPLRILPDYQYAIIDEGHHLEKVATHFLGKSLDFLTVRMMLSQLGLYEQKQVFYKIETLAAALRPQKDDQLTTIALDHLIGDLFYEMEEFFKLACLLAQKDSIPNKKQTNVKLRIRPQTMGKELSILANSAERFAFLLKDVLWSLNERLEVVKSRSDSLTDEQMSVMADLNSLLTEMAELKQTLTAMMMSSQSDDIKWIEVDLRSPQNRTTLFLQPASVGDMLKTDFFQAKKSVVITSATLTVDQSYRYITKELGLEGFSPNELTIPSPFDYHNQVQLLIPEDLPEIKSVSTEEYAAAITEHIITIAEETKGRMLILFTANEMLKQTYELIKDSGFLADFAIIAQGITGGSQTRLMRNFKRYEKAILLGTGSFWEGVNLPGEDLTCLIIVRLPFSPPNDPFTKAKCEFVQQHGGNAFLDYSLPEAILRFKQGFGRLIRTETDRGIIIVLDKRIVSTNYGHAFLKSIPDIKITTGPVDKLVTSIHEWFSKE